MKIDTYFSRNCNIFEVYILNRKGYAFYNLNKTKK